MSRHQCFRWLLCYPSHRSRSLRTMMFPTGIAILFATVRHAMERTASGTVLSLRAWPTPPANLRKLGDKYGMPLPAHRIAELIDGRDTVRAHGTHEMPVWGEKLYEVGQGEKGEYRNRRCDRAKLSRTWVRSRTDELRCDNDQSAQGARARPRFRRPGVRALEWYRGVGGFAAESRVSAGTPRAAFGAPLAWRLTLHFVPIRDVPICVSLLLH